MILDRSVFPLLRWLRWAVLSALLFALPACTRWLGLSVVWAVALPALAVLATQAAFGTRLAARGSATLVAASVGVDVAAVAAVLWASGGPANPLSALLFVHVALAAALLPSRHALVVAGLATLGFGALFAAPDASCPAHQAGPAFRAHLYGMWGAFALGAALVAFFVSRVRRALAAREAEVDALRREAEEQAKFASLGTLAAGVAHELGTPLGTVEVLAAELEGVGVVDEERRAHARAIRAQIDRCRGVLARMRPGASRAPGGTVDLETSLPRAVGAWRAAHPWVDVELRGSRARLPLDHADLEAVLGVLLDNALDAAPEGRIVVEAGRREDGAYLAVRDQGGGVPHELEGRLGEPFATTKDPGRGMGLGLFLVRSLLEPVGGRLDVSASPEGGTVAALRFASA